MNPCTVNLLNSATLKIAEKAPVLENNDVRIYITGLTYLGLENEPWGGIWGFAVNKGAIFGAILGQYRGL